MASVHAMHILSRISLAQCKRHKNTNWHPVSPKQHTIKLMSKRTSDCLGGGRAVDNALMLFRVWPFKNVGALLGHANAAAYADNMHGCGKF